MSTSRARRVRNRTHEPTIQEWLPAHASPLETFQEPCIRGRVCHPPGHSHKHAFGLRAEPTFQAANGLHVAVLAVRMAFTAHFREFSMLRYFPARF